VEEDKNQRKSMEMKANKKGSESHSEERNRRGKKKKRASSEASLAKRLEELESKVRCLTSQRERSNPDLRSASRIEPVQERINPDLRSASRIKPVQEQINPNLKRIRPVRGLPPLPLASKICEQVPDEILDDEEEEEEECFAPPPSKRRLTAERSESLLHPRNNERDNLHKQCKDFLVEDAVLNEEVSQVPKLIKVRQHVSQRCPISKSPIRLPGKSEKHPLLLHDEVLHGAKGGSVKRRVGAVEPRESLVPPQSNNRRNLTEQSGNVSFNDDEEPFAMPQQLPPNRKHVSRKHVARPPKALPVPVTDLPGWVGIPCYGSASSEIMDECSSVVSLAGRGRDVAMMRDRARSALLNGVPKYYY
jgi:hypothetical protein